MKESRNMIIESSRITRSEVRDLKDLILNDYDGIVFPGGFGVAKNFSDFAFKGKDFSVDHILESKIKEAHKLKLPIASCCISPLILSFILGKKNGGPGIKITLGDNKNNIDWPSQDTIEKANKLGNNVEPNSNNYVIDKENKIITSPDEFLLLGSPDSLLFLEIVYFFIKIKLPSL